MNSASVCVRRKRNLVKHCDENEPGVKIRFGVSSDGIGIPSQCGTLRARNPNGSGGIEARSPAHNRTVPGSSPGGPTANSPLPAFHGSRVIAEQDAAHDHGESSMS